MILGRCYAIQKKSEVTIFDFTTTFIFKTTFDLQVFIHNPGEAHNNSIPIKFKKYLTNEEDSCVRCRFFKNISKHFMYF